MATLINGFIPNFLDISVIVNNVPILKGAFEAINYDFTKDDGIVQANQEGVVGFTSGYVTCKGSLTMLQQDFNTFSQNIILGDPLTGGTVGTSTFSMFISFIVNDLPLQEDQLIGCKIVGQRQAHAKGNTEALVEVDLVMVNQIINGVPAVAISSPF